MFWVSIHEVSFSTLYTLARDEKNDSHDKKIYIYIYITKTRRERSLYLFSNRSSYFIVRDAVSLISLEHLFFRRAVFYVISQNKQ